MKRRTRIFAVIAGLMALAIASLAITISYNSPCTAAQPLPAGTQSMHAIVHRCYGSPEVLNVEEVVRPAVEKDRILVKVHAAAINPLEWHYMRGSPYIMRLSTGLGAPNETRLGVDFAGTVEAVGANVTRFKPGDEVFGGKEGALAEYVNVAEAGTLALKPANLTFEQAASIPIAATTALQALRDHGHVRAGTKVLINGASGGVGTFAVQIARALGAEVTGVCSTRNVALVRSLGAHHVIDYTREDFTQGTQRYDMILDNVGNHSVLSLRRALVPNGTVVIVGAAKGDWISPLSGALQSVLLSPFVNEHLGMMLADLTPQDLKFLGELAQSGKLVPVIDRHYPLRETQAAMTYLETGRARGKVVIDLEVDMARRASHQ